MHNPTFKRPEAHCRPGRSPSPPSHFVEPLSPILGTKSLAPIFTYPAVTQNEHGKLIGWREPEAYHDTTAARSKSTGQKSRSHRRVPSNIDALAEVALATSPAFQFTTTTIIPSTPSTRKYAQTHISGHGGSEPPHKRARSEFLPPASLPRDYVRPATSHEMPADSYQSRAEEAALLLNFRAGGWPASDTPSSQHVQPSSNSEPVVQKAARPHANSLPREVSSSSSNNNLPHSGLLPPFRLDKRITDSKPSSVARKVASEGERYTEHAVTEASRQFGTSAAHETELDSSAAQSTFKHEDDALSSRTPSDEASRTTSIDPVTGEAVEAAPVKKRRGWPKGKPRGPSSRKAMVEKPVSKRSATRRKTTDAVSRSKAEAAADSSSNHEAPVRRRNSQSNAMPTADRNHDTIARSISVPRDIHMVVRSATLQKPARRTTRTTQEVSCAGCAIARDLLNYNGEAKDEWISCNGCKQWFHFDCAGFKKAHEVRDVDKYFCPPCEPVHGKTTYVRKSTRAHVSVDYAELQKGVLKTSEESMEHHYIQPIKDGTFQFDPEFFPRMPPELVTKDFFERGGFIEPICIPASLNPRPWQSKDSRKDADGDVDMTTGGTHKDDMDELALDDFEYDALPDVGQDKLGMIMPQDLTVRQVCSLVGPETPLDVIDVKTQNSGGKKWNLKRWADYYEESGDKHIRNVISLEVSQTKLGKLLRRPQVVRDIDLQDQIWPAKEVEQGKYPKVQFYCLMSVADSYTDFHIDFGGSSVYYHILKGKKTFFFIPPTPKHLKAYQDWNDSHEQNYTFLPDITKECYRVDLGPGDTMLIPSGWIHAVWTPATSLVIGGNFLTRMSYRNQFRVYDIEKANGTPMKFRYPYFVRIMWYTVIQYLEEDPLPEEVSQSFLAGKQFEREAPIWADFDGELAAADSRPGAQNHRYYSQAEVDGLPDLAQFVFRTVMVVMGRVEGISAEQMKRVNSSIPKGHGDPLDLARAFGLWVAWKRGNEDPPAWAHPDAVLPNRNEEGPPKKLSQRALKEMERKEAIAAWRVAPDRQSARVKKNAAAVAAASTNGDGSGPSAASPERESQVTSASTIGNNFIPTTSKPPPPSSPQQRQKQQHGPIIKGESHQDNHQSGITLSSSAISPSMTTTTTTATMMTTQAMPFAMNAMHGQHLSTPKTSVLGPKRVACDACRKRRIRCKHKDFVLQIDDINNVSPVWQASSSSSMGQQIHQSNHPNHPSFHRNEGSSNHSIVTRDESDQKSPNRGGNASAVTTAANAAPADAAAAISSDESEVLNDNIQVTPLRTVRNGNYLNNFFDGHQQSPNMYGSPNDRPLDGSGLTPGTNAYVNANIPMAMNGIHIFGDAPKRGRSKACLECRKSKRRCIHDENGQVDPIKAAETPIPRGSVSSKKRPFGSEGSPPQAQMNGNDQSIQHQHGDDVDSAMRRLSEALGGSNHVQTPPVFQMQVPPQASIQAEVHHIPDDHDQNSLPIDPSLSAMYCDPNDPTVFASHEHQFANTDRVHAFEMPSLEQIASEVLDMNGGHGHPDEGFAAQETEDHQLHALKHDTENITADLKSELHKPDGSVDSAISLAASDSLDKTPPVSSPDTSINAEQLSGPIQRSVELNNAISASESAAPAAEHTASIPLYRPPPPPSASPELSKRQPLLPITGSKPASAALPASTTPNKRKRDSLSEHSGSPSAHKKLHIRQTSQVSHNGEDLQPSGLSTDALAPLSEEEMESMELAKALQQDDLGLRKRSK